MWEQGLDQGSCAGTMSESQRRTPGPLNEKGMNRKQKSEKKKKAEKWHFDSLKNENKSPAIKQQSREDSWEGEK